MTHWYSKNTNILYGISPPLLVTKNESNNVLPFITLTADWLDLSTANQHLSNNRLLLATQIAKQSTSPESAVKALLFDTFLCVVSSGT